jgi:hypothetical protein
MHVYLVWTYTNWGQSEQNTISGSIVNWCLICPSQVLCLYLHFAKIGSVQLGYLCLEQISNPFLCYHSMPDNYENMEEWSVWLCLLTFVISWLAGWPFSWYCKNWVIAELIFSRRGTFMVACVLSPSEKNSSQQTIGQMCSKSLDRPLTA